MAVHACRQGPLSVLSEGVGRHGHDGDSCLLFVVKSADSLRCLVAVHLRHLHVHKNQVIRACRLLLQRAYALSAVLHALHLQAHVPQDEQCDFCVEVVVLCQQDALALDELCALRTRVFLLLLLIIRFVRNRMLKRQDEPAALAQLAFYLNRAALHLHQLLHDGHAQACAADFADSRIALTREGIEKRRQIFLAHAHAVIGNLRLNTHIAGP